MRWITLAEKMPSNLEDVHLRYANGKEKLVYDWYGWYSSVKKEVEVDVPPPDRAGIHFGMWGLGGGFELTQVEWLDESEEIVISPFSDDFAGTNKRLKEIWHLDSVTRDGQMEADFQRELPFIIEYYRHQYLYWKNKSK